MFPGRHSPFKTESTFKKIKLLNCREAIFFANELTNIEKVQKCKRHGWDTLLVRVCACVCMCVKDIAGNTSF